MVTAAIWEKSQQGPQRVLSVGAIPCFLAGWGVAVSGHYLDAKLLFVASGASAAVGIWYWLAILKPQFRILWTAVLFVSIACVLYGSYLFTCPPLTVDKSDVTYLSKGDKFMFRVTNRSESDSYANMVMLNLNYSMYSTGNCNLNVERRFLVPLQEQSSDPDHKMSDTFVFHGTLLDDPKTPLMLIYIYRLTPHETRELLLRFDAPIYPASPLKVTSKIVSNTDEAVPTHELDGMVTVPVLIKDGVRIRSQMYCLLSDNSSTVKCESAPMRGDLRAGCFDIGFNYDPSHQHPMPKHIDAHCELT